MLDMQPLALATTRLLEVILEKSRDNIAIADQDGILLTISPSFLTIYGGEADDFLNRSVFELERSGLLQPSVTAVVLREKREIQLMQQTLTGRTVMAQGIPVFDAQGGILRVVSFSHDLTDLQLLREEYERLQQSMLAEPESEGATANTSVEIGGIYFRSTSTQRVYELLKRVAITDANVLLLGESGVGKTLFAQSLHSYSRRSSKRFVELNCAVLPEGLIESELFGYEGGAFTGARQDGKPGLIEQAAGGTLFLDEIGELPLSAQAKLLKVLQDRRLTRVGGVKERAVDMRLVAATNQNLKTLVEKKQFRLDLYYRLNVIPISIPPLRQRREDIPVLVEHFWSRLQQRYNANKRLHPELLARLSAYHWPGNVRELENILERAFVTGAGSVIHAADELFDILPTAKDAQVIVPESTTSPKALEPLAQVLARTECEVLRNAREHCKTTYEMAKVLGISQPSVVRKLQKHKITSYRR